MGDSSKFRCQPQVSLTGRAAWVVEKLQRLRGTNDADAIRWVLDQWIDAAGREYLKSYEIDLLEYVSEEQGDVIRLNATEKKG